MVQSSLRKCISLFIRLSQVIVCSLHFVVVFTELIYRVCLLIQVVMFIYVKHSNSIKWFAFMS